jgi:hypothetical protein
LTVVTARAIYGVEFPNTRVELESWRKISASGFSGSDGHCAVSCNGPPAAISRSLRRGSREKNPKLMSTEALASVIGDPDQRGRFEQ